MQSNHTGNENAFASKSRREIRKMTPDALNRYFRGKRRYRYENHIALNDRRVLPDFVRKWMIRGILMADRAFSRRKVQMVSDRHTDNGHVHIYAATHVGPGDVETVLSVINQNASLLQGDVGKGYCNFTGALLDLNGRICFDTGYQYQEYLKDRSAVHDGIPEDVVSEIDDIIADRHIAEAACIERLNQGGNLLIFPEGAYNVSRKPLMPLFNGVVRMAIKSEREVDVIPIALVRRKRGHLFQVMIGENISLDEAADSDVVHFTEHLTDTLQNMLSDLGKDEEMDDDAYFAHLTDIFEKPIDEYTLDVALRSCRFNPDDRDQAVIQRALKKAQ